MSGIDPARVARVYRLDWREGSDATLASLDTTGAIVEGDWGRDHDIGVGDVIRVTTPTCTHGTRSGRGSNDRD